MKLKGIYVLGEDPFNLIYGAPERARIAKLIDISPAAHAAEAVEANPAVLADIDVIFSGWGCVTFTPEVMAAAPQLKAVFYGAGSIRGLVTDAFWERGIPICSAWGANAIPVSEYTLSHILFGLKSGWQHVTSIKKEGRYVRHPVAGAFGSTVGLISLGMIGRLMIERLKAFEVKIIAYDPFVTAEQGAALGVEMTSLEDVFQRADVVSVHTPWLKETEGLITGALIASMKPYSTFINSSRGAIIAENDMIAVLQQRPDLVAVLDVTHPEPPVAGSPLYTLPNVILTPHIAGSMENECRRQGQYMIDELERFLAGQPLRHTISREHAAIMA